MRFRSRPWRAISPRTPASASAHAARPAARSRAASGGQQHWKHGRERHQVEHVCARQQVVHARCRQRRREPQSQRRAPPQRHQRPERRARQQDVGEVVLELLVGLEAAVVGARQGQSLERLLVQGEADRLVPEVARGGDDQRQDQHGAHSCPHRPRPHRGAAAAVHERREHGPGDGRHPNVEPEGEGDPGQRAGRDRRTAGDQDRAEAQRERRRVGAGDGGERHGQHHGQPSPEGQRHRSISPRERVRQHRHRRVEQHAHDPPGDQRGAEEGVEPSDEEVLAGAVVGVEVAIRELALGDPRCGLEHQALVVRVDAPPDGAGRQQGAEREEHGRPTPRRRPRLGSCGR